jgi:hypothetical protein
LSVQSCDTCDNSQCLTGTCANGYSGFNAGAAPTCDAVDCPVLTVANSGTAAVTISTGDSAPVTCDDGYTSTDGNSFTATCDASGPGTSGLNNVLTCDGMFCVRHNRLEGVCKRALLCFHVIDSRFVCFVVRESVLESTACRLGVG